MRRLERVPYILDQYSIKNAHYGYIYFTTNNINGKMYIGQHINNKDNTWYKGSGDILKKAEKKYGIENFICKAIDYADSQEELDNKEVWWIQFMNAAYSNDFYNISLGGGGHKMTEERKRALSEKYSGCNNPNYGKHYSEETKRHWSNIRKGKFSGENHPMYGIHRYGVNAPMYGKRHSEESKRKMRDNRTIVTGENHHRYGVSISEEAKEK